MELRNIIIDSQYQILTIKRKLRQKIKSLPDNPNIKRINKNCYIMNFSEIRGDKDMTLSAEYYDFKHQYSFIIKAIKTMGIDAIINNIETWIKSGYVNYKGYSVIHRRVVSNRLKLHPQVIEYLKNGIK